MCIIEFIKLIIIWSLLFFAMNLSTDFINNYFGKLLIKLIDSIISVTLIIFPIFYPKQLESIITNHNIIVSVLIVALIVIVILFSFMSYRYRFSKMEFNQELKDVLDECKQFHNNKLKAKIGDELFRKGIGLDRQNTGDDDNDK